MQQPTYTQDPVLNLDGPPILQDLEDADLPSAHSVLLVLRSQLLREGMKRLLTEGGFTILGEATNSGDALSLLQSGSDCTFDLVIIDAALCGETSRFQQDIRGAVKDSRIILLADDQSMSLIGTTNLVDADGILSSEISPAAMIQSLRLILLGERVVPSDLILTLLRRNFVEGANTVESHVDAGAEGYDQSSPTPRETQILRCLLLGSSNKIIARQLGITEATVKVHVKGLLRKIRASNRTQAAIWALNNGIEAHGRETRSSAGSHVV
jgi:two-component system, NarL family, nitrate/nitrite response regulator NarL